MKNCPRCNSPLFADMDMCFECLYDYNNPNLDYAGSGASPYPLEEIPLDEPIPIDAYSQDYATFESDARDASYLDPYAPRGSDIQAEEEWDGEEAACGEAVPERAIAEPTEAGRDAEGDGMEDSTDGGQDAGLFADPVASVEADHPVQTRPATADVRLGILVHWRGMEMATVLGGDRLTIGRDRANDIAIASFDVPAFAASIEPVGDGAELDLLAEDIEARLDGIPIDGTVRIGAGQEVDLYGARLSLIRLD